MFPPAPLMYALLLSVLETKQTLSSVRQRDYRLPRVLVELFVIRFRVVVLRRMRRGPGLCRVPHPVVFLPIPRVEGTDGTGVLLFLRPGMSFGPSVPFQVVLHGSSV